MNAPKKTNRKPKPMSDARKQAEAAVKMAQKLNDEAKSPQEKAVSASRLTLARNALKAVKFSEIVPLRVTRIARALNTLTKMANRSAYAWTPDQAKKIVQTLGGKVLALQQKLESAAGTAKADEKFDW